MRRWTVALASFLTLLPVTAKACTFTWERGYSPAEIMANPEMRTVTGSFRFIQNPADRPKADWLAHAMSVYPGVWAINVWIPSAVIPNKELPIIILYNNVFSTDNTIRTTINVGN